MNINNIRFVRLIDEFINKTKLDLNNFCVLTEAATGYFWVTPIIAAKAGARVIAYAKDSAYATAAESINYVKAFASRYNVQGKITFTKELNPSLLNEADIITNSFALRPIDNNFIQQLKKTAVIPLMYESWEYRQNDLDLKSCIKNEILTLGVNENSKLLPIFKNTQMLILKMLFENDFEVNNNRFILVSEDSFGDQFDSILKKCGAIVYRGTAKEINNNIDKYTNIDAIIVAEYTNPEIIISDNGIINIDNITKFLPGASVINFSGRIDNEALRKQNVFCYPKENVGNFKMAKTFSFLGIKPVLELMGAGLKVGEIMHNNRVKYDYKKAKSNSLKHILCQDIKSNN